MGAALHLLRNRGARAGACAAPPPGDADGRPEHQSARDRRGLARARNRGSLRARLRRSSAPRGLRAPRGVARGRQPDAQGIRRRATVSGSAGRAGLAAAHGGAGRRRLCHADRARVLGQRRVGPLPAGDGGRGRDPHDPAVLLQVPRSGEAGRGTIRRRCTPAGRAVLGLVRFRPRPGLLPGRRGDRHPGDTGAGMRPATARGGARTPTAPRRSDRRHLPVHGAGAGHEPSGHPGRGTAAGELRPRRPPVLLRSQCAAGYRSICPTMPADDSPGPSGGSTVACSTCGGC